MHPLDLDHSLWLLSDLGKALLLSIIFRRRLFRTFPFFFAYVFWDLLTDLLIFLILSVGNSYSHIHYGQFYYSANIVLYLLQVGVLLEIAANVLRPKKRALSRNAFYSLAGATLAAGIACFFLSAPGNAAHFFTLRTLLLINTAGAILCVAVFVLIAASSQLLGLNWKNHVLQLTTGLAFYSIIELVVELMQSELRAGASYVSHYQMWSEFGVIGYLCTLSFWCYAFLKKEAPRKEFSPQMAQVLVLLSGGAKRQHAVLARSRDD